MPYKSDAQRRKFHALEAEGKLSPSVVKEYDKASKGKKLPEKVKPRSTDDLRKISREKFGK